MEKNKVRNNTIDYQNVDKQIEEIDLMKGHPPPKDKIVTSYNAFQLPYLRWAIHHTRKLRPTVKVWRGDKSPYSLDYHLQDLDKLEFVNNGNIPVTLEEILKSSNTDAFLVMHRGKVVYEKRFIDIKHHHQHGLASVTKSFIGILIGIELHNGTVDSEEKVEKYIPELSDSAFGDATIQQLLDMQISCEYPIYFPEDNYIDNQRKVLLNAMGSIPVKEEYTGPKTIYDFLSVIQKKQEHGTSFSYSNGPTEVLGWILGRVNNKPLAELLSDQIWSKIGAEEDAYFAIDNIGTEQACGGLNATLRDLGRFGEMIRNKGVYNGMEIVPYEVIENIRNGGDRELFAASERAKARPGYSYRNQWWHTHNKFDAFEANGLHGQRIHIAPLAEMVIVQLSTDAGHSDEKSQLFNRVFETIASFLNQNN